MDGVLPKNAQYGFRVHASCTGGVAAARDFARYAAERGLRVIGRSHPGGFVFLVLGWERSADDAARADASAFLRARGAVDVTIGTVIPVSTTESAEENTLTS